MSEALAPKRKTTTKKETTRTTSTVKQTAPTETEMFVNEPKVYDPTDPVTCVSVTSGQLIMVGRKTKNVYSWADYGDTTEVEYQDLKAEKLVKGAYIYSPLLMIEDEDVLDHNDFKGVKELYERMLSIEEIDSIFSLDTVSFRRTLASLPNGLKNTIKCLAAEKIKDGTLDSIQKIKIIDSELGTDLFNSYLLAE